MSELFSPVEPMTAVPPEKVGTKFIEESYGGAAELHTRLVATGVELITVKRSAGPTMAPSVAVICDVPVVTAIASPVPAPMVATAAVPDTHMTLAVRFCVVLSL